MEHDPMQPIEQRHRRLTLEQEAHAHKLIESALDERSEVQPTVDTDTARVIAACFHGGYGTLLEHFAGTGKLNPIAMREELDELRELGNDPRWFEALRDYLNEVIKPAPDRRPIEFTEPEPEAFLRSPDGHGNWVPLLGSTEEVNSALEGIDPHWRPSGAQSALQLDRRDWEIVNTVGFHGIRLDEIHRLRKLVRMADCVKQWGEAFAAYLDTFGVPAASGFGFRARYQGSFPSMTEAAAEYAEALRLFCPTSPTDRRVRGPTISTHLLERSLRERLIVVDGRTAVHLFRHARGG